MSNEVCFLEEIAIANMYGTEAEKRQVGNLVTYLIDEPNALEKIVELAVVIEEIKRREITHMDWNCCYCSECERIYNCRIKWYRGERDMTQYCCSYCQRFDRCLAKFQKQEKTRKYLEEIFIINVHGTDEELAMVPALISDLSDTDNFVKLAVLAEEIRYREVTRLDWKCCPKCNRYASCRIKWVRGEKGMQDRCCGFCQNYGQCLSEFRGQESGRRIVESIFIAGVHGDDREAAQMIELASGLGRPQNITRLTVLAEKIRMRELSKMDWYCCYECQSLTTCKINWERGSESEETPRNCCSYCRNYRDCLSKFKKIS